MLNFERIVDFPSFLKPVRKVIRSIAAVSPQNSASEPKSSAFNVSDALLSQLLAFEIPRSRAIQALTATKNAGLQHALDYIFATETADTEPICSDSDSAGAEAERLIEFRFVQEENDLNASNVVPAPLKFVHPTSFVSFLQTNTSLYTGFIQTGTCLDFLPEPEASSKNDRSVLTKVSCVFCAQCLSVLSLDAQQSDSQDYGFLVNF